MIINLYSKSRRIRISFWKILDSLFILIDSVNVEDSCIRQEVLLNCYILLNQKLD